MLANLASARPMVKQCVPQRQLRMTELTHSFLVPAYRQSPFLRECLRSLTEQTRKSPILISTSTPFQGLEVLAQEFGAQLHVHGPNQGMAHDWNAGLRQVQTDWVTIAHQDDVYLPSYAEQVMSAVALAKAPILAFSNYAELLGADQVRRNTRLLRIKQMLLHLAFIGRTSIGDRWSKLNALRFGSPIPCPAVTLKTHPGQPHFETGFRLNMDWAAATSPTVISALALQGMGYVVWWFVLSQERLSVAFAISGAFFYLVMAASSWFLYDERLNLAQWIGLLLITAGVLMVNLCKEA